jgi:sugar/nucleoside kinase (ribokinase family)
MLNKKPYLLETPLVFENYSFSLRNFFKEVLAMGPSIVVVTNGGNGVYAATQESLYFHPSADITVCDNIGAGDAFGSSFVGSLLLGDSLEKALRNGIVNSASVLQKMGAKPGLLTRKQQQEQAQKLPQNALTIEPL